MTRRPRPSRRSRPGTGVLRRLRAEEGGSVLVLAGVAMAAVLGALALSVDLGRLAASTRELQGAADIAALDAVRAVGDLADPGQDAHQQAVDLASAATSGNAPMLDKAGLSPGVGVELGRFDPDARSFAAGAANPNAVRVTTSGTIPRLVLPGADTKQRQAIAMVEPDAGVRIGSILASADIDTDQTAILNRVLGGLLDTSVSLDAVSYRALADADVSLGDLAAALGAGTPQELLDTQVTVASLLDATATALTADGTAASVAAATPVRNLGTGTATPSFRFGKLVAASPDKAAMVARINVLDLAIGAAEIANGTNAVTLNLPVTIPNVSTITANLVLVEPPQIAVGPARQNPDGTWMTTARTAQGRLLLTIDAADGVTIPTPTGDVSADLHLPVYADVARGTAELHSIACARDASSTDVGVQAATAGADAYIGDVDPSSLTSGGPASVPPVTLVDVAGLVRVDGSANETIGGTTQGLTFNGPFDDGNVQHVNGSLALGDGLASGLGLTVDVLGAPLPTADVTSAVASAVDGILADLDTTLLPQLTGALGLSVGNADVGVFHADCSRRVLVR